MRTKGWLWRLLFVVPVVLPFWVVLTVVGLVANGALEAWGLLRRPWTGDGGQEMRPIGRGTARFLAVLVLLPFLVVLTGVGLVVIGVRAAGRLLLRLARRR